MITPRVVRLVRAATLADYRAALVSLATGGDPLASRDRLVVVPTRAAAAHLLRTIEDLVAGSRGAVVLPDLITPGEIVSRLAERLPLDAPVLSQAEREVLLGVASRAVQADGIQPPFRLRPGLVAEMLGFYDALRRHRNDTDTFERLALGVLEPGAAYDRGAERLVRQTRFLAAAFRAFERRSAEAGLDEHAIRARLVSAAARRPCRHVVLAVVDRAFDPDGLYPADWDLLARLPGLARLDVLVTNTVLAGACHERMHRVLPGLEEVRVATDRPAGPPRLLVPPGGGPVHVARDREDEVATFARRVRQARRDGDLPALDRAALVVARPLPYVYLAREVLRSGGVPCQLFDALPLAAEPYAAGLDLVLSAVGTGFGRAAIVELLRSPGFQFAAARPSVRDVAAFDRALSEAGYTGPLDAFERIVDGWRSEAPLGGRTARALRAGEVVLGAARELAPLAGPAPVADHLTGLLAFLRAHEAPPPDDEPLRARHLRARGAVLGLLDALRDAYGRFDDSPVVFEDTAALVRRWVEAHTFAPRSGASGVHVVDAAAARFGEFSDVQLAGLVDGEWPNRPRHGVFYSAALLRELGWPAESDRRDGIRAAFLDLIRLPSRRLAVSSFALEADVPVSPSPLVDELERAGLERLEDALSTVRIFDYEALALDPPDLSVLSGDARAWADARLQAPPHGDLRYHGVTRGHQAEAWAVSALERYQDCPFRFFAADVLRLEETPADEALAPRAQGRMLHEVFERFFAAWDARGGGPLTSDRLDEARALAVEVADPLLERLPEADRVLERARLFGSAIAVGVVDVVLGLEAARPADVRARLLEHRFEGSFSLGDPGRTPVRLTGIADRIDLLSDRRLRVIDYKSGQAPSVQRALQVPIYALCAQEQLTRRDGAAWHVGEAAYVALGSRRPLVPVVASGASDAGDTLDAARARLDAVLDSIASGAFAPQPYDPRICGYCAYAPVCRKADDV